MNLNSNAILLKNKKEYLVNTIKAQKITKKMIINYIQIFADSINDFDDVSTDNVLKIIKNLKHCLELNTENISFLEKSLNSFDNIIDSNNNDLNHLLEIFSTEYSDTNKKIASNTINIQECLSSVSENVIRSPIVKDIKTMNTEEIVEENNNIVQEENETEQIENLEEQTVAIEKEAVSENTVVKEEIEEKKVTHHKYEDENFSIPKVQNPKFIQEIEFIIPRKVKHIENTLVVSEATKSVTLPYKIDELNHTLQDKSDKYSSIDEIILESYTLPIDMFKNPLNSRFKQAYNLIRKKEHGSIFDALELGLELMFNYKLHPAIIAACKNLQELDMYLDYLSEGKTNDFKCFNIKFDLPPAVIK